MKIYIINLQDFSKVYIEALNKKFAAQIKSGEVAFIGVGERTQEQVSLPLALHLPNAEGVDETNLLRVFLRRRDPEKALSDLLASVNTAAALEPNFQARWQGTLTGLILKIHHPHPDPGKPEDYHDAVSKMEFEYDVNTQTARKGRKDAWGGSTPRGDILKNGPKNVPQSMRPPGVKKVSFAEFLDLPFPDDETAARETKASAAVTIAAPAPAPSTQDANLNKPAEQKRAASKHKVGFFSTLGNGFFWKRIFQGQYFWTLCIPTVLLTGVAALVVNLLLEISVLALMIGIPVAAAVLGAFIGVLIAAHFYQKEVQQFPKSTVDEFVDKIHPRLGNFTREPTKEATGKAAAADVVVQPSSEETSTHTSGASNAR